QRILRNIGGYARLSVPPDFLMDAEKIATGAFSPLTGFMDSATLHSVLHQMKLPNGIPWSIPVVLMVPEGSARNLTKDQQAVLFAETGLPVARLHIKEIYKPDKGLLVEKTFETKDAGHPGVQKVMGWGAVALAGDVHLLNFLGAAEFPLRGDAGVVEWTPAQCRNEFARRGWSKVVAFQTRNPPHRAHEYVQKAALELVDGLLVHPILGSKKEGDFPAELIMECYRKLLDTYYPKERAALSGLSTWMRYAGPREAVFHAIVRKNYGCSHFIVGRDHAGVGSFYPPYAAQDIFNSIVGVGVEILKLKETYYCIKCDGMVSERTCPHREPDIRKISMTSLRRMMAERDPQAALYLRPEVAALLAAYYAGSSGPPAS
ncbi:MAG: sulfate adenylyltransferase, partial [bacterium]